MLYLLPSFGLTGASVGGDTADVVSAPGFHGDGVESPRRQRREDALVVSGRDAFVLQRAVVVTDQNHVTVQISSCVTPVHLNAPRYFYSILLLIVQRKYINIYTYIYKKVIGHKLHL